MNGKVAKNIRRYALVRFENLSPLYKAKLRFRIRKLYKMFKDMYYTKGRSFKAMVKATI